VIIGGVEIPIGDRKERIVGRSISNVVTLREGVVVPPHCDVFLNVILPTGFLADKALMLTPELFVDVARNLHSRVSYTLLYSSCPVVNFSNLCDYPIKLKEGQHIGKVELIQAGTRMTYLSIANSSSTFLGISRTGHTMAPVQGPPTMANIPMSPQWPSPPVPSNLDHLWNELVDQKLVERVANQLGERWYAEKDCDSVLLRQCERGLKRRVEKGKFDTTVDADVLKYLDTPNGAFVQHQLSLTSGVVLEPSMANREVRRSVAKLRRPGSADIMGPAPRQRAANLTVAEEDSDGRPPDPFGLTAESLECERVVECMKLAMDSPEEGFEELVIKVDRALAELMKKQLCDLLKRFSMVFTFEGKRLGKVRLLPMEIKMVGEAPIRNLPYRESPRQLKLIKESMSTLRSLDIIERGSGPMAALVVIVLQNGKWRFCVDFRGVNSVTPLDRYPIPKPDTVFTALANTQFFSTMDANKGYHQFKIAKRHRHLTAFTTQQEGQWQYTRVPFGLQNALAFFQRSMDSLLGWYRWKFCLAYIDDIVVWSKT